MVELSPLSDRFDLAHVQAKGSHLVAWNVHLASKKLKMNRALVAGATQLSPQLQGAGLRQPQAMQAVLRIRL